MFVPEPTAKLQIWHFGCIPAHSHKHPQCLLGLRSPSQPDRDVPAAPEGFGCTIWQLTPSLRWCPGEETAWLLLWPGCLQASAMVIRVMKKKMCVAWRAVGKQEGLLIDCHSSCHVSYRGWSCMDQNPAEISWRGLSSDWCSLAGLPVP